MGRWVGQKMAKKIGYPLWMAPYFTVFKIFCVFNIFSWSQGTQQQTAVHTPGTHKRTCYNKTNEITGALLKTLHLDDNLLT